MGGDPPPGSPATIDDDDNEGMTGLEPANTWATTTPLTLWVHARLGGLGSNQRFRVQSPASVPLDHLRMIW
jgi:hypothetical protein